MDLHPENNKIFAELIGLHICKVDPELLRCKCGSKGQPNIPDYAADSRLVLREMERIGKLMGFLIELNLGACGFIYGYILDTAGELRDDAIRWLKEAKCSDQ